MANGDSKRRGASRHAGDTGLRGSSKSSKETNPSDSESRSATAGQAPAGGSERAWRVAQLAATLATRFVVHPGQSTTGVAGDGDWTFVRDEAVPELDRFYLSLLRRAEFLLAHGEARAGRIHASQLFDPFRRYSIKEITDEFHQARWSGLTSENSVRALFAEVGDWMEQQSRTQLEHLLRAWLDPRHFPHRVAARLPKGGRRKIEQDVAGLLKNRELIKDHPGLPEETKRQAGLEISRHQMIRDALGVAGPNTGINPYAALGVCCDAGVMVEKLWRRRAELDRQYPL